MENPARVAVLNIRKGTLGGTQALNHFGDKEPCTCARGECGICTWAEKQVASAYSPLLQKARELAESALGPWHGSEHQGTIHLHPCQGKCLYCKARAVLALLPEEPKP